MSARLGVDLGTTWTAAALSDGKNVQPVKLGASGAAMPSVVAIADGSPVAGDAAVRVGRDQPTAVAREFKRRLGDSTPIVLAGTPYGPEALTGHLLSHVLTVAGGAAAVSAVTLSHPATWGEFKLDLLREAGRVAGLSEIELIPEPVAAAGHYARLGRLSAGDSVAVYDFGGGTFDAAVVRVGANGPELLGRAEGLDRLGGLDLDQAVMAHVNAAVDGALTAMDRDDPEVRRAALELRAECIAAKEALSADTDTTIPVRFPGLNTEVRMTRVEFESAVRPRVAETLSALDRAIASAGLSAGDLAGIVLVGGSSRIPLVVEQVTAHAGRPVLVDADPKLSVATGAAEPNLRPAHAGANPTVISTATATREAAMSEPTRSTPPPPPGAKATEGGTPDGGAAAGAGAASAAGAPPRPGAPAARPGAPKPSERRTASGNAAKEKSGMSGAAKAAAGVAAAGAATAAAVLWGDQVTDALGITGEDEAATDDAAADADAAATDESMDAFDAVAPAGAGGGGGGGGFGGGGGGGGGAGGGFAPPRPRVREAEAPDMPPPMPGQQQAMPLDPEFVAARTELLQRLESWTPPEGANAEEAEELRGRLEAMINRYEPRPGQSIEDAMAELKDEFDMRIDNFIQDEKIGDLTDEQNRDDQPDPEFQTQRQQLLDRLENWTPPPGTSPERATQIRTELQAIVNGYQPVPGQSADNAMAQLQFQFDARVRDFEQEDKIEILIDHEKPADETPTPGEETPGMETPGAETPGAETPGDVVRPTVMPDWWKEGMPLPNPDGSMPAGLEINADGTFSYQPTGEGSDVVRPTVMPEWWKDGMPLPNADGSMPPGLAINADGTFTYTPVSDTPTSETPGTETPGMETPGEETPGEETPGMETPGGEETPGTETPGMETPGMETPGEDTPGTEAPGMETPGEETPETPGMETPEGTPASEPENTGIVPPHLQGGEPDPRVTMPAATADGLVDDFDAMLEAEAGALGDAASEVVADVVTAPAAAADGMADDVLGDMQVADAVLETPVPEMAPVGAAADPLVDVVMDSPPPLVDDFEFEIPAEPEITFEAPEFEPAMSEFEVDTDVDDLVPATDDASDDFLNP